MSKSKTNGSVKIHEAADLSPEMSESEFRELVEDIKANGLIQKIVMLGTSFEKSELLDGRHRYRALQELGIPLQPNSRLLNPKQVPDPWGFVLSTNKRRNLTVGQKAMMVAKYAKRSVGKPSNDIEQIHSIMSSQKAADSIGVGRESVTQAKKVNDNACVGLQRMVTNGTVAVSTAAVVAALPKEEQAALVKSGSDAIKAKAAEIRKGHKTISESEKTNPDTKPPKDKPDPPVEREPGDDTESEEAANNKPDGNKSIATCRKNLDALKATIDKADDLLGPFVRSLDECNEGGQFSTHKQILGHHQRLFDEVGAAKKTVAAMSAAWNRAVK